MAHTGVDGIVAARGAVGNPWLIRDSLGLLQGRTFAPPDRSEIYRVARYHLQLHLEHFGERKALFEMRKHLCWYAKGLDGSSHFRSRLQKTETCARLTKLAEDYFLEQSAV